MPALGRKFPAVIIFDVDGVLVDVRGSFQKTTLETVEFFTGKKVTRAELHEWKNRPGYNDDWKLSTAWVRSLGGDAEYDEVKRKFVELYWGHNGDGNVKNEKWLLPQASVRRLADRAELALFTGRTQKELEYTLARCKCRAFLRHVVTVEDVRLPKPDPEGLLKVLGGRDATAALYVGDNIDDALAARAARVPFVGVLPRDGEERPQRAERLKELGAQVILRHIRELEPWLPQYGPRLKEACGSPSATDRTNGQ
jgi:HAD superfamily hydrolase (TIGR01548 family)